MRLVAYGHVIQLLVGQIYRMVQYTVVSSTGW